MPPRTALQLFRHDQAFLPHQITHTIGLPLHVAHADLLIVAPHRTCAGGLAQRVRARVGKRYQFVHEARVRREGRAFRRLGLMDEPALFALPSIDNPGDGYLVRIEPDGTAIRICLVADLHIRPIGDVELVA